MPRGVHTKAAAQLHRVVTREHERAARAQLKAADARRLAELRTKIGEAKTKKRERLREVSGLCRAQRIKRTESAKARRAKLNDEIRAERLEDRSSCSASKDREREKSAAELRGLEDDRQHVHRLKRSRRAAPKQTRAAAAARSHELRRESDDQVRNNIDRRLWPVWEKRKSHTHATERASRTERFLEWVEENAASVYEILAANDERELRRLEQQERELARAMRKPNRYRGDAVQTSQRLEAHADDWGG